MLKVLPANPLHSAIVEVLTQRGSFTMKELHAILEEEYDFQFTPQYLYQVVSRLLDWEVLMKSKQKISLNVRWLSVLKSTAETALVTLRNELDASKNFILEPGKSREYVLPSPSAPAIWTNAVISAFEATGATEFDEYLSHPYWIISTDRFSLDHIKSVLSKDISSRTLIGNDAFLDKKGDSIYKERGYKSAIAKETIFDEEGYTVCVVGEYVIEFTLPNRVLQSMSLLYETVTSEDKFKKDFYQDILDIQEACTMTVSNDAARAEEIRAEIRKHVQ